MSGYVRIHRSLLGHPAFRNDGECMAFAWLVLKAAWRPIRVRYKERTIQLQRGQLAVSQRDMAASLERNKTWVVRFLNRLKSEAMIEADIGPGVAVITICNYDKYQALKEDAGPPIGPPVGPEADQERTTEQGSEEREEEEGSEDKSSGTVVPHPASDFCKAVFDSGRAILTQSGMNSRQAGSLIGKWRQSLGDADILALIRHAETQAVSDPASWLTAAVDRQSGKRTKVGAYESASGHIYRSNNPRDVMREAEARADWDTYYAAKSDLERNHG